MAKNYADASMQVLGWAENLWMMLHAGEPDAKIPYHQMTPGLMDYPSLSEELFSRIGEQGTLASRFTRAVMPQTMDEWERRIIRVRHQPKYDFLQATLKQVLAEQGINAVMRAYPADEEPMQTKSLLQAIQFKHSVVSNELVLALISRTAAPAPR